MDGITHHKSKIEYRVEMEDRLLKFAAGLLELSDELQKHSSDRIMANQLLRSGTSIGANFEEATAAESKADFIHKLQIALKESRETCYWLRLLHRSRRYSSARLDSMMNEALQLRAILTKAVFTAKRNTTTT
jgi:four helix bundle protein